MISAILSLLLPIFVSASPTTLVTHVSRNGNSTVSKSPLPQHTLDMCSKAHNCELFETDLGTMIRFKSGMEPGTDAYKKQISKRDDGTQTHVTMGDGSTNYGTVGASGDGGAVHHLYDVCKDSACDTTPFTLDTTIVGDTSEGTEQLVGSAQGQYNLGEKNVYIDAVVAAAGQGEKCGTKTWTNGGGCTSLSGCGIPQTGSENQCTQTNFISVNRFGSDGGLLGFVSVNVVLVNPGAGQCAVINGILGAIASAVGAVPGAEAGAAVAAGFFGIVTALCGSS